MTTTLKPFYFDVKITGRALVYAENEHAARDMMESTGVMVAGNTVRDAVVEFSNMGIRRFDDWRRVRGGADYSAEISDLPQFNGGRTQCPACDQFVYGFVFNVEAGAFHATCRCGARLTVFNE